MCSLFAVERRWNGGFEFSCINSITEIDMWLSYFLALTLRYVPQPLANKFLFKTLSRAKGEKVNHLCPFLL